MLETNLTDIEKKNYVPYYGQEVNTGIYLDKEPTALDHYINSLPLEKRVPFCIEYGIKVDYVYDEILMDDIVRTKWHLDEVNAFLEQEGDAKLRAFYEDLTDSFMGKVSEVVNDLKRYYESEYEFINVKGMSPTIEYVCSDREYSYVTGMDLNLNTLKSFKQIKDKIYTDGFYADEQKFVQSHIESTEVGDDKKTMYLIFATMVDAKMSQGRYGLAKSDRLNDVRYECDDLRARVHEAPIKDRIHFITKQMGLPWTADDALVLLRDVEENLEFSKNIMLEQTGTESEYFYTVSHMRNVFEMQNAMARSKEILPDTELAEYNVGERIDGFFASFGDEVVSKWLKNAPASCFADYDYIRKIQSNFEISGIIDEPLKTTWQDFLGAYAKRFDEELFLEKTMDMELEPVDVLYFDFGDDGIYYEPGGFDQSVTTPKNEDSKNIQRFIDLNKKANIMAKSNKEKISTHRQAVVFDMELDSQNSTDFEF